MVIIMKQLWMKYSCQRTQKHRAFKHACARQYAISREPLHDKYSSCTILHPLRYS